MILVRKQYLEGEILDGKEAYLHTKNTLKPLNQSLSVGKIRFLVYSLIGWESSK